MMRILGVDVGLNLGWATLDDGSYASGGTRTVKEKSKEHRGARWRRVSEGIAALLDETKPDCVAFEDVSRHKGVLAAHSFGYIKYSLLAACADRGVPTYSLGVSEWKKAVALKGNAKKPEVAAIMLERHGQIEFDSEDHSDALGVATAAAVLNLHREVANEDRVLGRGRRRKEHGAGHREDGDRGPGPPVTDEARLGQVGADRG